MHQHFTSLGENGKAYLGILVSLFILDECRKYLHDYNLYINFRNRFLEKPLMKQTTNEFPSPHNNNKKNLLEHVNGHCNFRTLINLSIISYTGRALLKPTPPQLSSRKSQNNRHPYDHLKERNVTAVYIYIYIYIYKKKHFY